MFLNLENAYSNVFHTAKFSQIPYRIYVNLFGNEKSLLEAECTLRRDYENALVKCVNNELWTFSFSENEPPPIPDEKFNLKEISTGVFLSSMLSSTNLTPLSQAFPVSYAPFILAVKELVYSQLVSQQLFLPFGQTCILAPSTGKLLYVEPKLFAGGEMIFRIYYKPSGLSSLKTPKTASRSSISTLTNSGLESIELGSTKVVIAPCAMVATLIELSVLPPPNSDQFIKMLSLFSGVSLTSRRDWVKLLVNLDPTNSNATLTELVWPADLCFFKPSEKNPDNVLKNDLSWFETPDILDGLEKQVVSLKEVMTMSKKSNNNNDNNNNNAGKLLNQNGFGNIGSDPASVQTLATGAPGLDKKNRSIYPTPPGFQPKPQQSIQNNITSNDIGSNNLDSGFNHPDNVDQASWGATPGGGVGTVGAESWGDSDDDLFGDGDEVTEADFNFFDQPGDDEDTELKNFTKPSEDTVIQKVPEKINQILGDITNDNLLATTVEIPPANPTIYTSGQPCPSINGFNINISSPHSNRTELKIPISTMTTTTTSKKNDFNIFPLVAQRKSEDQNEDFMKRKRRMTSFTSIEFNPRIATEIDDKYMTGGKFYVPEQQFENEETESSSEDDDEPPSVIQVKSSTSPIHFKNEILPDNAKNNDIAPTKPIPADISNRHPFSPLRKRRFEEEIVSQTSPTPIANGIKNDIENVLTSSWLSLLSRTYDADNVLEDLNAATPSNLSHILSSRNYDWTVFNQIIQLLAVQIVWDNNLLSSYIPSTPKTEQPETKVIQTISHIFKNTYRLTLFELIRISDSLKPPSTQDNTLVQQQNIKVEDNSKPSMLVLSPTSVDVNGIRVTSQDRASSTMAIEPSSSTGSDPVKVEGTRIDESLDADGLNKNSLRNPTSARKENEKLAINKKNQTDGSDNRNDLTHGTDGIKIEENKTVNRGQNNADFAIYLAPPMFVFRRTNQIIKAAPPALRFWKTFGFSPLYGSKNINLVMIYPDSPGVNTAARSFLESIKACYEGSGLGEVTFGQIDDINNKGLIPINLDIDKLTIPEMIDMFRNKLSNIFEKSKQRAISKSAGTTGHTVLLVANPFSSISSLLDFGHCFQNLRELETENQLDITLQLIPMNLFAEKNSMVIMSQYKLVRLALSIYDKIPSGPNTELTTQLITPFEIISPTDAAYQRSSPAFTLSKSPVSILNFKLVDRPSISALYEDTFIHLAYAYSADKRWVTVAWSDQWGQNSRVEAFCLFPQGMRPRAFEDVCADIWEKTMALTSNVAAHRYIACAKVGTVEEDEISMWLKFASNTNSANDGSTSGGVGVGVGGNLNNATGTGIGGSSNIPNNTNSSNSKYKKVSLIFVSVNIQSSLIITGDQIFKHSKYDNTLTRRRGYTGATGPPSSTTPTFMTPQRVGDSSESPDMYGTSVTTPSSQGFSDQENINNQELKDGDLCILDTMDETYGIILHHRILIGKMRDRLSLITGYLLKPIDTDTQYEGFGNVSSYYGANSFSDSLASIEISVVHSPIPPLFALKVLLKQYRNLASLGAVTGVTDKQNSLIPWHISACDKMLRVFSNVY